MDLSWPRLAGNKFRFRSRAYLTLLIRGWIVGKGNNAQKKETKKPPKDAKTGKNKDVTATVRDTKK